MKPLKNALLMSTGHAYKNYLEECNYKIHLCAEKYVYTILFLATQLSEAIKTV